MTTRRPRSSERTTFRGLRCLQTPFGQALAANGREHPTPGRGRGNQYDVIRSGCPEHTSACLPRTTASPPLFPGPLLQRPRKKLGFWEFLAFFWLLR